MSDPPSENPRITFAIYKLEDVLQVQTETPDPDFKDITSHKDEVLERYRPVFSLDHLPELSKAEFDSFLLFRNNHHWDSLHRVRKFMTEDMDLLRTALTILVDESRPIQDRLNELRPERLLGEHSLVSHLGMPVLTALLQVMYPDHYGVWNNTSDAGMNIVRLWDKRWESKPAGDVYVEMNAIYQELSKALKIDLWTLDALWWIIKK